MALSTTMPEKAGEEPAGDSRITAAPGDTPTQ